MNKSNLATSVVEADSSNYTVGRKGYKICKITPHHMASVLTAEQCGKIFQSKSRNASANYGIGNDGSIALYVDENNRAWTSSSVSNDCQAITIEVSNSSIGGDYPISESAWNALVNLCVDICKRYNFTLVYDGTPNGSLTKHNMFANTDCPGNYLENKLPELATKVNSILKGTSTVPIIPSLPPLGRKVGDVVTINGIYVASNSTKKLNPSRTTGTITKIINGALNPYLLDNGNLGWGNDGVIVSNSASSKKSNEDIANEIIKGLWGNGDERKNKLEQAGYDYNEIQKIVNSKL